MSTLKEIVEALAPVTKVIEFNGNSVEFKVRHITGAERLQILAGQKFTGGAGALTMEVDLQANETAKHRWIHFCVLNVDGSQMFASLSAVQRLPAPLVDALHRVVAEHNKEMAFDDLGKS